MSEASRVWQEALPPKQHSSEPQHFFTVTTTLLQNPNVTSSLLFRAEILFDTNNDHTALCDGGDGFESGFIKHMKADLRPRKLLLGQDREGLVLADFDTEIPYDPSRKWIWRRTVVRRLIPRNPQLDPSIVQTCWYFEEVDEAKTSISEDFTSNTPKTRHLVIYVPHADSPEQIPFYHPSVRALAILYTWCSSTRGSPSYDNELRMQDAPVHPERSCGSGELHLFYSYFQSAGLTDRLSRTALNLQSIILKHMAGQAAGYVKRVHHDLIIPQDRFQDTYTRLKLKYAKRIVTGWVEPTDPLKHVFEDIGIAAFLIEVWKDTYSTKDREFPGFVDIGCGNGLLVYLLRSEGYLGWGFDVRKRKTWDSLPQDIVGGNLKEMVCIPEILQAAMASDGLAPFLNEESNGIHNGYFPSGTFIISNHADELTAWTPLLALLSQCSFIAIPCCSHDFGGNKFRAKVAKIASSNQTPDAVKPGNAAEANLTVKTVRGIETGVLSKRNPKQPSAYAALCNWIECLTDEVGYVAEKEMLRIPSTRNAAILGRKRKNSTGNTAGHPDDVQDCWKVDEVQAVRMKVQGILVEQMSKSIEAIAHDWVVRTRKIGSCKGSGH